MPIPELLSPAGSPQALKAAVNSGADAVYLGCSAFGARASAVNFGPEELKEGVTYAHRHHCRVYVTVNTLIKPGELEEVKETLRRIEDAAADAVIVQDLGVGKMVRDSFPGLALHASTQMALCNQTGVETARQFGFDRVVLARECSLEDIRRAAETGVEIEVFVHGALCTAVSGRCLMSSMSGGRSGNRGRCAQPCRQEFSLGEERGALLSLRDLCLYRDLPLLTEAGVTSLKIEGRLKSPEYVAGVTAAYRRALDALGEGRSLPNPEEEMEGLKQLFNRGSFTRGHALGAQDAHLVTGDHVSHEGIPIGRVERTDSRFAYVRLTHSLENEDSLQFRTRPPMDVRYSGPDQQKGDLAKVYLRNPVPGLKNAPVHRLASARQLAALGEIREKAVPIRLQGVFRSGEPSRLTLYQGQIRVQVEGTIPSPAQSRPALLQDVEKQLGKWGNTCYTPEELKVELEEGLFLPVGELNALRRKGLEVLEAALTRENRCGRKNPLCSSPVIPRPKAEITPDSLFAITPDPEAVPLLEEAGASGVVYAPRDWDTSYLTSTLEALSRPVWLRLPPQMTERTLSETLRVLEEHLEKLTGLWLESFGQLTLLPELPAIAGEGVPMTNPEAAAFLSGSGLSACCHWVEWSGREIPLEMPFPMLLKRYGRQILMLLNHCPERVRRGLDNNRSSCALCREKEMACGQRNPLMTDRLGYRFPLMRTHFPEGCELTVLGALPTDLRNQFSQGLPAGTLLHFTTETPEEAAGLTRIFARLSRGEPVPEPRQPVNTAHWLRGVD